MSSEITKAPTLLVIDDDPDVLAVVDRFASELGFTVIQETNGQAALRSLPITKPDGAIIDVDLADIDGLSMLREMKAADPQSQVILMTSAAIILGMLPTALSHGEGSEFRAPMAISVIGGGEAA